MAVLFDYVREGEMTGTTDGIEVGANALRLERRRRHPTTTRATTLPS